MALALMREADVAGVVSPQTMVRYAPANPELHTWTDAASAMRALGIGLEAIVEADRQGNYCYSEMWED